MKYLENCQPAEVFEYFEEICQIPHESGNTAKIAAYLVSFAEKHGLDHYMDDFNNVIIRKPASAGYEGAAPVILQGHSDMVCQKRENVRIDFAQDPIVPVVDGDFIRTDGTTLGADNGIAIAMTLAILADDSLAHPPIEAVFTTDEETGMDGAHGLDMRQLKGRRLINIDSEEEGVIMCGCSGATKIHGTLSVRREKVKAVPVTISISGLKGGHSGMEIDKGRANANNMMGRILYRLVNDVEARIAELEGGSKETAITLAAHAVVAVADYQVKTVEDIVAELRDGLYAEYQGTEPDINITAEGGEETFVNAVNIYDSKRIADVLAATPYGVQAMSPDLEGLVQTSTNIGIVKLDEDSCGFSNSIRSSVESQLRAIFDKIEAIIKLADGTVVEDGTYPGWKYNPDSPLKDLVNGVWTELTGSPAEVAAIHAGLECGIFKSKCPDMDCVSIGPNMYDVHTPNEHLSISSTERAFTFVKNILAAMTE